LWVLVSSWRHRQNEDHADSHGKDGQADKLDGEMRSRNEDGGGLYERASASVELWRR
jgi:hypothetical protein